MIMSENISNTERYHQNPYSDEIDLRALFRVLWDGRWLIILVAGFSALICILVAFSLPNTYKASALLAPSESSASGLPGLMRQYGGLASLAGVSLPSGEEGSRAQLGMELMKSRAFIGDFVERRQILPQLIAIESWDAKSGTVVFDSELYDEASESWVRRVELPKLAKPSAQEAHTAFSAILDVSQDKLTGFVSVSIEHQSAIAAAQWVNWLVEDINNAVKEQDVAEAQKSIEYLRQQVANTSLADLQAMFFELIQSQTETVMLAEARPEYVFKFIDPAVVPEEKYKPSRALISVLGTLLGGMLGAVMVLIRHYARSRESA
jgi:uncharacterized protein involved in exopolysaccharide biosynthesis